MDTDNLKSAVTKAGKYQSVINLSIQDMAFHYGTIIDPTCRFIPKDKAMVEGAVKIVYPSIFYRVEKHTHFTIADLNSSILSELTKLNNRKLTHCDYS